MAKKLSRKKLIFGAIALLVVIAVGSATVFLLSPSNPYRHLRGEKGVDPSGHEIVDMELYNTDTLLEKGDLDGAKAIYDSRIKEAAGEENKAKEDVGAANAFVNLDQKDKSDKAKALEYALAYAKEAEQLDPTVGSAAILAVIYGATGNTERESYYYTKVDERSKDLDAKQHSIED